MEDTCGIYARQSRGNAKSIADQFAESVADAEVNGMVVLGRYQDGSSASRYATKARDEWARVLAAVEAREFDVLVLWESSRGDRDLPTWAGLLARCRERGVKIRVTTHGRTYDMGNPRDWRTLAEDGVDSAYESEKTSLRNRRAAASAAAAGRPAVGPVPFGYQRVYDPRSGVLLGQEPDPLTAPLVAQMISDVARSVPLGTICADLNARGVPAPKGGIWRRLRVRNIALNPVYIGQRRHKDATYAAPWPALVDEATFWAARRILLDPSRIMPSGQPRRPGKQVHLLTYLAQCFNGHPITAYKASYVCRRGCVHVSRDKVDDLVVALIQRRLEQPDYYAALRQAGAASDKEALAAQDEVARLRGVLDDWRRSAARGDTTPDSLAVIEAELTAQIREAEAKERRASLPPAVRPFLAPGADVAARWGMATRPAQRDLLRMMATITLLPCGRGVRIPIRDRVDVEWITRA